LSVPARAIGARFCTRFRTEALILGFLIEAARETDASQRRFASGHDGRTANPAFALMPTDQSSSNPAAGHNGHGARMTRKDGRHPTSKNHGRIAGRLSQASAPQSCAWFLFFEPSFFREPMKEDHYVQ
jgi:hypothetical protein